MHKILITPLYQAACIPETKFPSIIADTARKLTIFNDVFPQHRIIDYWYFQVQCASFRTGHAKFQPLKMCCHIVKWTFNSIIQSCLLMHWPKLWTEKWIFMFSRVVNTRPRLNGAMWQVCFVIRPYPVCIKWSVAFYFVHKNFCGPWTNPAT